MVKVFADEIEGLSGGRAGCALAGNGILHFSDDGHTAIPLEHEVVAPSAEEVSLTEKLVFLLFCQSASGDSGDYIVDVADAAPCGVAHLACLSLEIVGD